MDALSSRRRLVDGRAPPHRSHPRRPRDGDHKAPAEGLVHHSDSGTQYTSLAFGRRAHEAWINLSMGSTGDAYNCEMAESFPASLETELIDRSSLVTRADARLDVFDCIEAFYNPHRRHSALGSHAECRPGGWPRLHRPDRPHAIRPHR